MEALGADIGILLDCRESSAASGRVVRRVIVRARAAA